MRYLSVCSGIEAASVAWHHLGWQAVGFSEIEPFPSAVLAHRFPSTPNFGDMTKHEQWPIEPGSVDLLVGGTPCQSFSVAGLRQGLSDPRGGLMLTYLEIARHLKPRWIVWENVPGVLSSGRGRDLGAFLGALWELGYGWAYRVLDAQYCRVDGRWPKAVPQRRRRVFVVGCAGDRAAAAEVLALGQGLRWHLEESRASRKGAAADAQAGVGAGSWWDGGDCASTLTKQNANGEQRMPHKDNFGAVLQPAVYRWQNDRDGLQADDASAALRSSAGTSGFHKMNHPVVVQQPVPVDVASPTLTSRMQGSSGWAPYNETAHLVPMQPVPIQDGREMHKAQNGIGIGQQGDPAYTLDTTGAQAVGQPVAFRKSRRAQSVNDHETWVEAQQANTLNQFDTGERDTHAIAFSPGNLARGAGASPNSEVAPTMKCSAGRGADDQRTCVAIGTDCYNGAITGDVAATMGTPGSSVNASGPTVMTVAHAFYSTGGTHGVNQQPEVSPAVKVGSGLGIPSPPAVAHAFYRKNGTHSVNQHPEVAPAVKVGSDLGIASPPAVAVACPTLTAHNDPSRSPQSAEVTQQVAAVHATTMTVRRLTPRECERLQGFPDDWTMIPWRKKTAEDCPDGPRYKALGNSMAVNCMAWIGERIDNYERTGNAIRTEG